MLRIKVNFKFLWTLRVPPSILSLSIITPIILGLEIVYNCGLNN